jgi:hypothetical protein
MATKTKLRKPQTNTAATPTLTAPALPAPALIIPVLKITPQIIPLAAGHEDLLPPATGFQPHPGEYHIVALGPGGVEIAGSDFSYPPGKTFEKAFATNPKFSVKKKQQP